MGEERVLQFQPWQSAPDVAFWQQLATLKLHTFQLKDEPQVLRCLVKAAPSTGSEQ